MPSSDAASPRTGPALDALRSREVDNELALLEHAGIDAVAIRPTTTDREAMARTR